MMVKTGLTQALPCVAGVDVGTALDDGPSQLKDTWYLKNALNDDVYLRYAAYLPCPLYGTVDERWPQDARSRSDSLCCNRRQLNSLNERHAAERGLATVILSIILLQHDKVVQEGAFACDYTPRGRIGEFTCHHGSVRATDKLLKMLKDLDPQLSGTHDVLGDITAVLSSFVDRK